MPKRKYRCDLRQLVWLLLCQGTRVQAEGHMCCAALCDSNTVLAIFWMRQKVYIKFAPSESAPVASTISKVENLILEPLWQIQRRPMTFCRLSIALEMYYEFVPTSVATRSLCATLIETIIWQDRWSLRLWEIHQAFIEKTVIWANIWCSKTHSHSSNIQNMKSLWAQTWKHVVFKKGLENSWFPRNVRICFRHDKSTF